MGHGVNVFASYLDPDDEKPEGDHRRLPPLDPATAVAAIAAALRNADLEIVEGLRPTGEWETPRIPEEFHAENDDLTVEVYVVDHPEGIAGFQLDTTGASDRPRQSRADAYARLLHSLLDAAASLNARLWNDDGGTLITKGAVAELSQRV
jgi:hypothetical protein